MMGLWNLLSFGDGYLSVCKALCAQNEQLEAAQVKANSRVSNHKQATQLLQTELQDSRAQVEEKENTIQTLKSKLRESEVGFKSSTSGAHNTELLYKIWVISCCH